eukprot:3363553-Alexandrium_andersonii.AAC.1
MPPSRRASVPFAPPWPAAPWTMPGPRSRVPLSTGSCMPVMPPETVPQPADCEGAVTSGFAMA